MSETCCGHHHGPTVVDVRDVVPRERHPRIFATFDALEPGESFVLVNDHDPKPLFYQFTFERPDAFTWRYLEQGPETWRVEIARRTPAGPAAAGLGAASAIMPASGSGAASGIAAPSGPAFRITAAATVADVLARHPASLAVMERFGLNHCCGAHLTLAEAAAAAGASVDAVVGALAAAATARP